MAFGFMLVSSAVLADNERSAGLRNIGKNSTQSTQTPESRQSEPEQNEQTDRKADKKTSSKEENTVLKLEGTGFLKKEKQGGLGYDLWYDTPRKILDELIVALPNSYPTAIQRDLARRILLSETDLKFVIGDSQLKGDENFLTLRMRKLLDMGTFADAVNLYRAAPTKTRNKTLTELGLEAFLLSQDREAACIEVRATQKDFNAQGFSDLKILCDVHDEIQEKDTINTASISFPLVKALIETSDYRYHPKQRHIKKMSRMEQAILFGFSVPWGETSKRALPSKLPVRLKAALANSMQTPQKIRLAYALDAARIYAINSKKLADIYHGYSFSKDTPKYTLTALKQLSSSETMAYLYQATSNTRSSKDRALYIQQALKRITGPKDPAFKPFLNYVAKISPNAISTLDDMRSLTLAMLAANHEKANKWLEHYNKAYIAYMAKQQNIDIKQAKEEWRAPYSPLQFLAYDKKNIAETDLDLWSETLAKTKNSDAILYKARVLLGFEALGIKKYDWDVKKNDYVNNKSLTRSENYVMPSYATLRRLEIAASQNRKGEVIVLTLVALGEQDISLVYPGLLNSVIRGLVSVKLGNEARELLRLALLINI